MLPALIVKEIGALFVSPIAYAIIAVFLLLSGYSFAVTLIVAKQASLVPLFFQAAVQFILLVPILTMRLFAEERRTGTLELLLTSPAREIDIVLAKFAAAMTVLLAMIGLTLTYALVTGVYGDPDWGPVYSGYLGLILLAGALVSLGLAVSALTANQIVAAVVSLGVFGILWAIELGGLAAAIADGQLASRPIPTRAVHTLRDGRDVHLRFRLLPRAHPAWPLPDRSRVGAPLRNNGRASDRTSTAALGSRLARRGAGAVLGRTAPAPADAA